MTKTIFAILVFLAAHLSAQVPGILNYQGRVIVDGVNFDGTGQFKFALVNATGDTAYWSNDGSLPVEITPSDEPSTAVPLAVTTGLYSTLLGDTSLANMTAVPATVFTNPDVRLRVWFDDGTHGFQQLAPDQRIAAVGYALTAGSVSASTLFAEPSQPVIAWGANNAGQSTVPTDLSAIIQIAAGADHSLALHADGTVHAWGDSTVPENLTDVTSIAAGVSHSVAVKSNGTVRTWDTTTPVPDGISNVTAASAGQSHTLVLKSNKTVEAWGDNTFDQTTIPAELTGATVTAIASGYDHNLALKSDGTVVAWGRNETFQTDVPPTLTNVTAIAAGAFHSLAVKADGTVVAWGWNLGEQSTVPDDLTDVTAVAAGYSHSAALKSDGTVTTWGDNAFDQDAIPTTVTSIAAIAATNHHTLALRTPTVPAIIARLDEPNTFTQSVGIGRTATANRLEVEGNASKSTAGNWAANSDRRIKQEIEPVLDALQTLEDVSLVSFRYTDEYQSTHPGVGPGRYLNVIAQQFAQVFPEHVRPSGEHLPDGSQILQVDTYPLTIYAAAAIQELHRELRDRDTRIESLEDRLENLERLIRQKAK